MVTPRRFQWALKQWSTPRTKMKEQLLTYLDLEGRKFHQGNRNAREKTGAKKTRCSFFFLFPLPRIAICTFTTSIGGRVEADRNLFARNSASIVRRTMTRLKCVRDRNPCSRAGRLSRVNLRHEPLLRGTSFKRTKSGFLITSCWFALFCEKHVRCRSQVFSRTIKGKQLEIAARYIRASQGPFVTNRTGVCLRASRAETGISNYLSENGIAKVCKGVHSREVIVTAFPVYFVLCRNATRVRGRCTREKYIGSKYIIRLFVFSNFSFFFFRIFARIRSSFPRQSGRCAMYTEIYKVEKLNINWVVFNRPTRQK